MTQAIGMDQVGRLEPMRGARRGERSDGAIVPASQCKTELLVSSQKDERPLLRGSRCRWGTGFWMLTTVSSKPPPPPQRQVTGCDSLHRKSAVRPKRASWSACYSSVQIICSGRVRIEPDRPCSADVGVDEDEAGARWYTVKRHAGLASRPRDRTPIRRAV